MQLQRAQILAIAMAAHEMNRAYCQALGDHSVPTWDEAPEWQINTVVNGVEFHLANPEANASASHGNWLRAKLADGWVYGKLKDPALKMHPCIVPFEELPREQQAKDHLFKATVHILAAQQHRKITGYRELTPYEIALMNRIKAHGNETKALLDEVYKHLGDQCNALEAKRATTDDPFDEGALLDTPAEVEAKTAERARISAAQTFRWHAIAGTHLQEGLMALTRAVAQPTNF